MRLTVGPHAPAVYWRRRVVVLAMIAVIVLIVAYACGAPSTGASAGGANPGGANAGGAGPSPTSTLLHPTVGKPPVTATPTPTPYTLPYTAAASGPCTDAEIGLTASANPASIRLSGTTSFTLTIKNLSARNCARDIGAGPQTLDLLDPAGVNTLWSSDDCSNDRSSDIEMLTAGDTRPFTLSWNGLRSRSGTGAKTCTNATPVDPGDYQLVARLGSKTSQPFILHITA
jgi:hypothetical protein